MRWLALLVAISSVAAAQQAQHAGSTANPFNTAADIAGGGRIFRAHCAVCHGLDGSGGRGTDLTTGAFRHGGTDEDLFKTILYGVKGTEMPGMYFTGQELFQLIAYLRSLSVGRAGLKADGDPAKGRALFEGKGGCTSCHRVDDKGSRFGPDLTSVASRRSLSELIEAVTDPDAAVLPDNWFIRATARDGAKIEGRRMNEDTFTVQIIDRSERLVSLDKSQLTQYEVVKRSIMPSFKGKFSETELRDLVAYLATLQGGTRQ